MYLEWLELLYKLKSQAKRSSMSMWNHFRSRSIRGHHWCCLVWAIYFEQTPLRSHLLNSMMKHSRNLKLFNRKIWKILLILRMDRSFFNTENSHPDRWLDTSWGLFGSSVPFFIGKYLTIIRYVSFLILYYSYLLLIRCENRSESWSLGSDQFRNKYF
jgi:hypothetical protein